MQTLVHSVALLASLTALIAAIMSDHSLFTACKRVLISYFTFYCVTALLVLAYRGGVLAESRKEKPVKTTDPRQNVSHQQNETSANTAQEAS
jgi:hypothetical protein